MRTLLITRNFPPLVGGMERLNLRMCEALARHGEVALVGPTGSRAFAPPDVGTDEVPHRPLPRFLTGAFAATVGSLLPSVHVSAQTSALQFGAAIVVGLVAAAVPAWRCARVRIVDGLRAVG